MSSLQISWVRLSARMPQDIPFGRLLLSLLAVDALLVLAYLAQVVLALPSGMLTRLVDLDGEASLCMWFSSMQLHTAAVLVGLTVWFRAARDITEAGLLGLLGLMLLAMSIDEAVQIHEWLGWLADGVFEEGTRDDTFWHATGIWMFVIGIPAVAFASWVLYRARELMPKPVLAWFVAGLAVLLTGALVVEGFANVTAPEAEGQTISLGAAIQVSVEEGMEMLGGTLLLGASLALFAHERSLATDR